MTWEELRHCRARVPDHVVHRALALETVLLNIRTSTYHTVDETGARFFDIMRQAPSLEAACASLAEEYEQPFERIADDMATFCSELAERDLIELERVAPGVEASESHR